MRFPRPEFRQPSRRQWLLGSWQFARETGPSRLLRASHAAMACWFEILLPAEQREELDQCVRVFELIEDLESRLTVFDPGSEVSQINQRAFEDAVTVQSDLLCLLATALDLSRRTGGAFDISSAPLSRAWGFFERQGRLPSPKEVEEVRSRVGYQQLRLDQEKGTISFGQPREINLGAIGKGYALDRARRLLPSLNNFLLHAGHSTVLAQGDQPGQRGWVAGVRDPRHKKQDLFQVRLQDQALSSSGAAEQKFSVGAREFGHIIDPRNGLPAATHLSATAIATSAAEADALSTAFFIMSLDEIEDYCSQAPGVTALILSESKGSAHLHCFPPDRGADLLC